MQLPIRDIAPITPSGWPLYDISLKKAAQLMGHADMKMIMEVLVYSTLFHKITKPPKHFAEKTVSAKLSGISVAYNAK